MTTSYFRDADEMLRRAKAAGRQPGCHYGGIVLPCGRSGFAVYRNGKVLEQYALTESLRTLERFSGETCYNPIGETKTKGYLYTTTWCRGRLRGDGSSPKQHQK